MYSMMVDELINLVEQSCKVALSCFSLILECMTWLFLPRVFVGNTVMKVFVKDALSCMLDYAEVYNNLI